MPSALFIDDFGEFGEQFLDLEQNQTQQWRLV